MRNPNWCGYFGIQEKKESVVQYLFAYLTLDIADGNCLRGNGFLLNFIIAIITIIFQKLENTLKNERWLKMVKKNIFQTDIFNIFILYLKITAILTLIRTRTASFFSFFFS